MRRRSVQFLGGSLLAVALSLLYSIYSKSNQSLLYNIYSRSNQILLYNIDPKAASKYNSKDGAGARPYKIFYLVEQWPGTVCKAYQCKQSNIPKRFTIHGLWPQFGHIRPLPQNNCCKQWDKKKCAFKMDTINSLRSSLDGAWPDLIGGSNVKFWKHEWKKHGACSLDYVSQRDYFQRAIDRYDTYDLINILQDAGIMDNGSCYRTTAIKDAIRNKTKLDVLIKCGPNNTAIQNHLLEIILCVQSDANGFKNCTGSDKCRGLEHVKFPSSASS